MTFLPKDSRSPTSSTVGAAAASTVSDGTSGSAAFSTGFFASWAGAWTSGDLSSVPLAAGAAPAVRVTNSAADAAQAVHFMGFSPEFGATRAARGVEARKITGTAQGDAGPPGVVTYFRRKSRGRRAAGGRPGYLPV